MQLIKTQCFQKEYVSGHLKELSPAEVEERKAEERKRAREEKAKEARQQAIKVVSLLVRFI